MIFKELIIKAAHNGDSNCFGKSWVEQDKNANSLIAWYEKVYDKRDDEAFQDLLNFNIEQIIEGFDTFTCQTNKYLKSYSRDKDVIAERISYVIEYLNRIKCTKLSIDFLEKYMNNNKDERLLKILKYLHGANRNRKEIAKEMGVSQKALIDDLATLTNGFEFLGTKIEIKKPGRKENSYVSQVNPTFYALHTAEILSLTIGLKLLGQNTVFEKDFDRIAELTYSQLSDHVKEIIDIQAEKEGISLRPKERKYINTNEMMNTPNVKFTYFLKEPIKCNVRYSDKNGKLTETGILNFAKEGVERFSKVLLKTETKEIEIEISKIEYIERTDKEEYMEKIR